MGLDRKILMAGNLRRNEFKESLKYIVSILANPHMKLKSCLRKQAVVCSRVILPTTKTPIQDPNISIEA